MLFRSKILANNGLVSVVIAIDSKENKILMRPVIVSRGFVFIKDSQSLLREAENIVYHALKEKMAQRTTFGELKNCVRSTLEPFLYNKTHRNPIVIPVIINSKSTMAQIEAMRSKRQANKNRSVEKDGAKKSAEPKKKAAAQKTNARGTTARKSAPKQSASKQDAPKKSAPAKPKAPRRTSAKTTRTKKSEEA